MAHEYANRAFSSLEAAEDANWEFASSDTAEAEQEMLHHRQHLTAPSVKLFVQCQWSKMTRVQTELMFQAIESYKPGTRLRFSRCTMLCRTACACLAVCAMQNAG